MASQRKGAGVNRRTVLKGMGAAGAMARLGGLLAPSALALLVTQNFTATIALFAVLLIVGAIATALVNAETRRQALQ